MRTVRVAIVLISAMTALGCGSGGGDTIEVAPAALWGEFRQNGQRTAFGFGLVENNDAIIDMETVDEISTQNPFPSAIVSSPSIDVDGTVYVGTEGGTLAAYEGGNELKKVWSVNSCGACPAGDQALGRLISSPIVYEFKNRDGHDETNVVIGSADGAVFLFRFFQENSKVDADDCDVCFWRGNPLLQQSVQEGDSTAEVSAEFISSPTFTINLGTGSIAGIYIGARITVEHGNGSQDTFGKLYAINNDGSLRWEFPRTGEPKIGAVTSSPTFALGNTLYFPTDIDPNHPDRGDVVYGITEGGNLKRSIPISGLTDPEVLLTPSIVAGGPLFIGGVDGTIHAMNPDGTFRWTMSIPGQRFTSSLMVGSQAEATETPEAAATPTPTGTQVEPSITATPTPTLTPLLLNSTVLGVTESGMLVVINSSNGDIVSPTGEMPSSPVEGTVVSSPALAGDLFVTYATTGGQLFAVNTANGQFPRFCDGGNNHGDLCTDNIDCVDGFCAATAWPILLPKSCRDGEHRSDLCDNDDECPGSVCARPAIRSSPSMDVNGRTYFGADDGRLYYVGVSSQNTPGETVSPEPTPTPGPSSPTVAPPTASVTPTIELIPTATSHLEPTPSPTTPPVDSPTVSPTEAATAAQTQVQP